MNKPIVMIPLLLLIFFVVFKSFFSVQEGMQAIVLQFGEPIKNNIKEAGLYFKLPWQTEKTFEQRIIKWDGDANEIPTKDKTFIYVDTIARWRIADPLVFYQSLNNKGNALTVIGSLIDGAVRDVVTKNNLVDLIQSTDWKPEYSISTEKASQVRVAKKEQSTDTNIKFGRDKFSDTILSKTKERMKKRFGIKMIDVFVKRLNYIEQVRNRVYERMISERQRIAAKKRSEGAAQKAVILGGVERELNEISSVAYRESEKIKGGADATATRITGEAYKVDPEFYAFYTTLDSYKHLIGDNTKLIIGADSDLYKHLKNIRPK